MKSVPNEGNIEVENIESQFDHINIKIELEDVSITKYF